MPIVMQNMLLTRPLPPISFGTKRTFIRPGVGKLGAAPCDCGLRFYSQSITFASASAGRAVESRNHVNDSDASPRQGRKGGGAWCCSRRSLPPIIQVATKRSSAHLETKEISLVRPKRETGPESSVRSPTRQVEVCPSVVFLHTRARTWLPLPPWTTHTLLNVCPIPLLFQLGSLGLTTNRHAGY
ncbi:Uncharacterized protein DBV15_03168 [Temnothorax longispinosus]|uniref:Uncharacterized protein n=1 Tax=Temnothorax longispinosus TaxID=300112 RepID=A0A4S2KNA2_9HYME|nr:Uncharacterized protein DBV15_03168 [Temnothorax longispinosus]